ncbi:hypothetical protein Ddc_16139 [Ditylenchus destructor]|nr:hypothetical protein Ddc_16139 [Ditylenchus destructor]
MKARTLGYRSQTLNEISTKFPKLSRQVRPHPAQPRQHISLKSSIVNSNPFPPPPNGTASARQTVTRLNGHSIPQHSHKVKTKKSLSGIVYRLYLWSRGICIQGLYLKAQVSGRGAVSRTTAETDACDINPTAHSNIYLLQYLTLTDHTKVHYFSGKDEKEHTFD